MKLTLLGSLLQKWVGQRLVLLERKYYSMFALN